MVEAVHTARNEDMSALVLVEITGGSDGLTFHIDKKELRQTKEENNAAIFLCKAIQNTLAAIRDKEYKQ